MLKLISATPSPYARKVRIALAEKDIPFELITEVPWNSTTQTPQYNPLEKLPVLIIPKHNDDDDDAKDDAVYESRYILEYLELKYPDHPLVSKDVDEYLLAKKIEVLVDGVCDALLLRVFEKQREQPSKEWEARQLRKVDGGLKQLNEYVGKGEDFVVGGKFGLGDLAIGSVCGFINLRFADYGLNDKFPGLAKYCGMLEERESFKTTRPKPQTISDKIV